MLSRGSKVIEYMHVFLHEKRFSLQMRAGSTCKSAHSVGPKRASSCDLQNIHKIGQRYTLAMPLMSVYRKHRPNLIDCCCQQLQPVCSFGFGIPYRACSKSLKITCSSMMCLFLQGEKKHCKTHECTNTESSKGNRISTDNHCQLHVPSNAINDLRCLM